MSVKDILVHVDGGEGDKATIAAAVAIAVRFGARLTGLFARTENSGPSLVARQPSDQFKAAAASAQAAVEAACRQAGLVSRWWLIPHGGVSDLISEVLFCGYYADLVIIGQDAAKGVHVHDSFAEALILKSGRPVLMIPKDYTGTTVGARVALGWRAGREAARAVADSLPFLESADMVKVVAVGPRTHAPDYLPPVNVVEHLSAHGIQAEGEQLEIEGLGVMDALLSRAYDHNADLLVVGAHGGYVLPLGRGSATRHLLRHAQLPVMFSH
ncbi:MAG: universal stress protein [Alphaproteobacteria bacterium]|nr:universal stress protein [Alphaproteobacteria bacterium]